MDHRISFKSRQKDSRKGSFTTTQGFDVFLLTIFVRRVLLDDQVESTVSMIEFNGPTRSLNVDCVRIKRKGHC
jgi:hypothetical protein